MNPHSQQQERSQSRSAVEADCQTVGALLGIELPGGVPPTYPQGQIHGMRGSAKEMGHRVVGGAAIGAGGVIGPAKGVAVGLEP